MPSDAPAVKRARVEADGAQVVVVGTASDERRRVAEEIAAARGLAIIPPYDDTASSRARARSGSRSPRTCPMSRLSSSRSVAAAWRAGVAAAISALAPDARVIGVEPELAADARDSLGAGPDRRLVRGPGRPHDRRRHSNAVDRPAQLRPPAGPARRRDHRLGARDRGRRPARGRGGAARRRAVGRPRRSRRCGSTPRRPDWRGSPVRSSASSAAATWTPSATSSTCRRPSRPRHRRRCAGPRRCVRSRKSLQIRPDPAVRALVVGCDRAIRSIRGVASDAWSDLPDPAQQAGPEARREPDAEAGSAGAQA